MKANRDFHGKEGRHGELVFSAVAEGGLAENVVFITGVTRSGTTLLGQLVGSLVGIEYAFEPLVLAHIPALYAAGHLKDDVVAPMLSSVLHELLVERVLGRKVNLRPSDNSRFYGMKSHKDLKRRWSNLHTREDVEREVNTRGVRLAVKKPDLNPLLGSLLRWFPESQIIDITRHGFDVAASVGRKGWVSDPVLQNDVLATPRRRTTDGRLVPAWVPAARDIEDMFLSWNAPTRALFKWRHLVEEGEKEKEHLGEKRSKILDIRFEDLVTAPLEVIEQVQRFLGDVQLTSKTEEVIQGIDPTKARQAKVDEKLYDEAELNRAKRLVTRLGYQEPASI